jgi:hypothetical protein
MATWTLVSPGHGLYFPFGIHAGNRVSNNFSIKYTDSIQLFCNWGRQIKLKIDSQGYWYITFF